MEVTNAARKRALNMVWTAAGDYSFDPLYLFFYKDDSPCLYLNTLEGIAYTKLSAEVMIPFCKGMECGRDPATFRTFMQLVLEEKVFRMAEAERPGLVYLRRQYAERRLAEMTDFLRYQELSWERQCMIRFNRILGREMKGAYQRELDLADLLEKAASLPEAEMVEEMKRIFWDFFLYRFVPSRESEKIELVGAGLLLYLFGKIFSGDIMAKGGGLDTGEDRENSIKAKTIKLWKHMLSQTTDAEDRALIRELYGPCIFTDNEMRVLTDDLCIDHHATSRLWFATSALQGDVEETRRKNHRAMNLAYYRENQRIYERGIRRITEKLRRALEEQQEPDVVPGQSGKLKASVVYRAKVLHDLSVFHREIAHPLPDFTVDILLDASSSREKEQCAIATQAYMIAKSLSNLQVPVQVTCFQSIRGYTILQKMKAYEQDNAEEIFKFRPMGSNRDGLALRAYESMMHAPVDSAERRILLVLTDAQPKDTRAAYEPGVFSRAKDYEEDLAVEDTAAAVRALRRKNIEVAAIFLGDTYGVKFLRRIYGNAFIRILNTDGFPDAVIGFLLRILASFRDK